LATDAHEHPRALDLLLVRRLRVGVADLADGPLPVELVGLLLFTAGLSWLARGILYLHWPAQGDALELGQGYFGGSGVQRRLVEQRMRWFFEHRPVVRRSIVF